MSEGERRAYAIAGHGECGRGANVAGGSDPLNYLCMRGINGTQNRYFPSISHAAYLRNTATQSRMQRKEACPANAKKRTVRGPVSAPLMW
jgi:hypothetical protein